MKRTIISLFFALTCIFSYSQVTISGANGITDGTNYTTLKAAFAAITSVPNQTGKDILIAINQSTTETSTASLAISASTPWNSLKIYPTVAGLTISADFTTNHLINFFPVSNVTIDGSVGGVGTDKSLTIAQSGESAFSTIAFQNDSRYNTVKNCILKGGKTISGRAIISLMNSVTTGNDYNTITNNDFTGVSATQKPFSAIYAVGASGKELDNLVISNNNFYDLLMETNFTNGTYSTGIYFNGYVNSSSITGNSFYETTPFTSVPTFNNTYAPIFINNATGSGISISDNYIGGSAPQCGGSSPMSILSTTNANTYTNSFAGINIAVGPGTASSIQNNTIKNIAFRSTTTGGAFTGINILSTCTGSINIGTVTGNKIGSYSETTITYTGQKSTGGNSAYGIANAGTGNIAITGNTIGGIDNASSLTGAVGDNMGIYCNGVNASGTNTVDRNFVTGLTASGSLATIWGIRMAKGTTNYINNIVSIGGSTTTAIYGMYMDGVAGTTNNVYFNTVFISGAPTTGSAVSYAMNSNSTNGNRDIRNNIFYNSRTGGTGLHYAIKIAGTTGLTDCNYNDYFINGTNFLGNFGGADKTSLSAWASSTTKDVNSLVADPVFSSPKTNVVSYLPSASVTLTGTTLSGFSTDYDGTLRPTTPRIGAYESSYASGNVSALPTNASVTILSGSTLTVDENKTLNNVTVQGGGKLTNNMGGILTVANFKLNSDATNGTGTYVENNGTLNVTGTTTVSQYLNGGRNWYISSPVANATCSVINTTSVNNLWKYNENNTGITSSPGSALWDLITDSNEPLVTMKGYVAKLLNSGGVNFVGVLNTGNQSISLDRTAADPITTGYNLVGNPYPSYLDWESAIKTNLSTTIWYRTRNSNNTAYVFDTYNGTSHVGTSLNGVAVTGFIPPMQSFWVRVASGSGVGSGLLEVNNTMRSHENGTNRMKVHSVSEQQLLRLQVSNEQFSDEAILIFNNNASDNFDDYDSPKRANSNDNIPEIYTVVDKERLVINGMSRIPYDTEIPLGFNAQTAGTFSIKASEISNFDSSVSIYLKDYNDIVNAPVKLTPNTTYTFSSNTTANNTSRFALIFKTMSNVSSVDIVPNDLCVKVFRNVNNQITVDFTGDVSTNKSVVVYNAVGQKLVARQLFNNITVLDYQFGTGVYFVTLNADGNKITKKVIIN